MRHLREPELPALASLLPSFSRGEVVVVGDFVADEYVYGETDRVSREAPVLIVRYESSELKPGGAGNAAQNLAALGVKVRQCVLRQVAGDYPGPGKLGHELFGEAARLAAVAEDAGVEVQDGLHGWLLAFGLRGAIVVLIA